MGSSGKKKTTMAKMARENKLRERRLNKQAKKDARRHAVPDRTPAAEAMTPTAAEESSADQAAEVAAEAQMDEPRQSLAEADTADPRAKEVALTRLRESSDRELALFEDKLRNDARDAGATESEVRHAQRDHPGHEGELPAR
jgi:hypothetical protein